MKKTCLVFLCTYNGEKYIRQQLDSILAQKDVDVFIKIADDMSTDSTVDILREYAEKYSNISFTVNEVNKRFTYNFIDLYFSGKNSDYDYYAFSDQDDVWLDNKLIKAIEKIEEKNGSNNGCLYCSNLIVTDENLSKIGMQEDKSVLKADKRTFLYTNICTGCTVVCNKDFYRHSLKYYPENIYLHDYWFFLVAAYTADYIYDFNGYIFYRQHGNNQIGTNKSKYGIKTIKKFVSYRGTRAHLVGELVKGFGKDMGEADLKRLKALSTYNKNFLNKLYLLFTQKSHTFKKTLELKIKILFNKL